MEEDQLKRIIKEADTSPAVRIESSELSRRVYLLYRKRKLQRLALTAGVLVVCGIVTLIGLTQQRGRELVQTVPNNQQDTSVQTTSREIEEIKHQIEQQEMLVAHLKMAEKRQQFDKLQKSLKSDAEHQMLRNVQVGRAAASMLLCADYRAKEAGGISVARDEYKSVIQIFPNTIWARQAEEKLAALKP